MRFMISLEREQTRNTPLSTALLSLLIPLLLAPLGLTSCSKQREQATPSYGNILPIARYSYPHTPNWSAEHMSFYSKLRGNLDGSRVDCTRCHESQGKTLALNVSCATKCHTPTTSEERDEMGLRGPTLTTSVANTCSKCHGNMIPAGTDFAHFPAAVGLCNTCHDASASHQDGTDKKGVTTKSTDESCYQCHFKKNDKPHVHPALEMGDQSCVSCHEPHGAKHRYFVREDSVQALCSNCHEPHEGKSVHGAEKIDKNCVNCHNPHSTVEKKLLRAPTDTLCLDCHNRAITTQFAKTQRVIPDINAKMKTAAHQHSGTQSGCLTCHQPHASANDRLLTMNYSPSNYNLYDTKPNPYELCLFCHDPGMLEPGDTSTGFRSSSTVNGKTTQLNLHWFHVRDATGDIDKNQGRSCRICHDPHGSSQDFQMNETWDLNGIPIPIVYKRNTDGGTCTNTCHENRSYQRF